MRIRNLRIGRDLILNRFNSESVTQFYTHPTQTTIGINYNNLVTMKKKTCNYYSGPLWENLNEHEDENIVNSNYIII